MTEVSFNHGTATVTDKGVLITSIGSLRNANWLIRNAGPSVVYLGGEGVTADQEATGGFPVDAGQWLPIPATISWSELYGIVEEGEARVSWLSPQ